MAFVCRSCGASGQRLSQDAHRAVCARADVVPADQQHTLPRASEFLLRVKPLATGGFEATCQPVSPSLITGVHGEPMWRSDAGVVDGVTVCEGLGANPLAACINALANSQIQDVTETQAGQVTK